MNKAQFNSCKKEYLNVAISKNAGRRTVRRKSEEGYPVAFY